MNIIIINNKNNMKYFIIAEKPDQARSIANGLEFKKRGNKWKGTLKGGSAVLMTAVGHVIDFKEPREMKDYKDKISWVNPKHNIPIPRSVPLKITKKIGTSIVNELKNNKYDHIVCATDPDDEGYRIFYNIIIYARKTNASLLTASLTGSLLKSDVKKAFSKLNKFSIQQYNRSYLRSSQDWMYQILTAGYTGYLKKITNDKEKGYYSIGRVQTFTLNLIKNRTEKHFSFKEDNLYIPTINVNVNNQNIPLKIVRKNISDIDNVLKNENIAKELLKNLLNKPYKKDSTQKEVINNPFMFFNLLSLQKSVPQYPTSETLSIADKIRLGGGLTYIRTDYKEIPDSYRNEQSIKDIIYPQLKNPKYKNIAKFLLKPKEISRILKNNKLFTKKPRQHHGIVLTTKYYNSNDKKQKEVYDRAVRNTLLTISPPSKHLKTTLTITFKGIKNPYTDEDQVAFKGVIDNALLEKGYLQFISNNEEIKTPINIKSLDNCKINKYFITYEKTKKPPLYTETTLIEQLTNCHNLPGLGLSVKEKTLLKDSEGIGRPSSRNTILKKLLDREYITKRKKGNYLLISNRGQKLLKYCPPDLYSEKTTLKMLLSMNTIGNIEDNKSTELTNKILDIEAKVIEKHLINFSNNMKQQQQQQQQQQQYYTLS